MAELILTDVRERLLHQLRQRAASHGRTPEEEATAILEAVLANSEKRQDGWAQVDAIRARLAASGRTFSDSAELLREDRDR
jgi:antitoxin FitA